MAKKRINLGHRAITETIEPRVMLSTTPTTVYGPIIPTGASVAVSQPTALGKSAPKSSVRVGTPSTSADGNADGLTGAYYVDGYKEYLFTRNDSNIDFIWKTGSAPDPAMVGRRFAIRWTGQIVAQYSEVYKFSTMADDGVRVWVGGKLVVNDWEDQWASPAAGTIRLEAGQTYDIRVDYYENGEPPGAIRLFWSSASTPRQIIPASAFRTVTAQSTPDVGAVQPVPAAPVSLTATAASQTQINLAWNDVSGENGFIIERSSNGTDWAAVNVVSQGTTHFSDNGLTANTTYFYRVRAFNSGGQSDASNVASATTLPVPVSPDPSPTPPPFPTPPPDQHVYGLTNDGKVELIDTTQHSATEVGELLFGTSAGDRDPITGNFYYIDQNTSAPRVAVWDPTTNTNTLLGTANVSGFVLRAAFRADGTLFITAGNGDVYTIDRTTGAATLVGTLKENGNPLPAPSGDMAFAQNGDLYLDENSSVYKVNLADLSLSYIGGDESHGNVQIAFGSDGKLYGTDSDGGLYTINLNTGLASFVGSTGITQIGDLASAAV